MTDVTNRVVMQLVDDVSSPAKKVADALKTAAAEATKVETALGKSDLGGRLKSQLRNMGASVTQINAVSKAWTDYAKAEGLAANRKDWTKEQVTRVRAWEAVEKSAIKSVMAEERAQEAQRAKMAVADETRLRTIMRRQADAVRGGSHGGDNTLMGLAGLYVGHQFAHGAHQVLERYQEFDNQRRYAKAVMGLTDEQQEPLVQQALKGGATTRFNDIQWLEGQREFAARGYKTDQVLAFTKVAATLGTALDQTLPESVKLLEGAMLGFGKDTSTYAKAVAAAQRTADLEVKASKISGMDAADVQGLYKYAASPSRMAGLSEESMLMFGAISKKANLPGEEAGTAYRALVKNLLTPTAGAKTALLAAGIDYTQFQHMPDHLNLDGFTSKIAREYGIKLDGSVKAGIGKIFSDPAMINNVDAFVPAMRDYLKGALGSKGAKDAAKIAESAEDYRDKSATGVDANKLLGVLVQAIAKNPALANAYLGSKAGGKVYAALGDPGFVAQILDQLQNHSEGYAQKVADERNAGFDGAVKQLQGAIATLESSLGRSLDAGGKGGALTDLTRAAARATAALSEANPKLLQAGSAAAALVAGFAAVKGAGLLTSGFGLKGSAAALDRAAAHLMEVGGGLGHGGGMGGGPGEPGAPGGKKLGVGRIRLGAAIAGAVPTLMDAYDYAKQTPEEREKTADDQFKAGHEVARQVGDAARSIRDKIGLRDVLRFSDDNLDPDNEPSIRGRGTTMNRDRAWHARVASPPVDDPYLGGERPAIEERARRGAADFRRDPESARGRAMMRGGTSVDTSGLKRAAEAAGEAEAAIAGLNMHVSPQVDTSALDAVIAKAHEAAAAIAGIGKVSAGATVGARGAGSYRSAMNGSFAVDSWRRGA